MDLKKEIKLSDLFRRKPGDDGEPEAAPQPRPERERRGFLSLRARRDAAGEGAAAAKPPKEPSARRAKPKKGAPPLPQVPLMRAFNLVPKDETKPRSAGAGDEEGGRRPSTAQLVLAVAGLLLVAALASFFLLANAQVADKEAELDDLKTRLAALNVAAEKPSAPEPDQTLVQERDRRTGALATALGQRVAWDRLLREISLVLPDDVWLSALTTKAGTLPSADPAAPVDPAAGPPASTFELTGYTREQENVAQLLSRIAVLPEVAAVQLVSATATTIGKEDVVEFVIAATMKPAGAGGTA